MSTDEKSPERCALECADTADIIPREPCSGFWERWFSCCCRRVLQLRRASPTRRHLIKTIHHLEKALPFKKKKKKINSPNETSTRKCHTADTMGWSDLRHKGPGSSAWPYSTSPQTVSLRCPEEGMGSKKGLPQRVGAVTGKKAKKVPLEKQQQTDSVQSGLCISAALKEQKNTFADFPCHWFLPNSLVLLALSLR